MKVELFDEREEPYPGDTIARLREFLQEAARGRLTADQLNVVFLPPEGIARLNEKYRGKVGATDVLSFALDETAEVYVCPEASRRDGVYLALHGLLHLAGRDHTRGDEGHDRETARLHKQWRW